MWFRRKSQSLQVWRITEREARSVGGCFCVKLDCFLYPNTGRRGSYFYILLRRRNKMISIPSSLLNHCASTQEKHWFHFCSVCSLGAQLKGTKSGVCFFFDSKSAQKWTQVVLQGVFIVTQSKSICSSTPVLLSAWLGWSCFSQHAFAQELRILDVLNSWVEVNSSLPSDCVSLNLVHITDLINNTR